MTWLDLVYSGMFALQGFALWTVSRRFRECQRALVYLWEAQDELAKALQHLLPVEELKGVVKIDMDKVNWDPMPLRPHPPADLKPLDFFERQGP
jgi:hypothetical protein